jgi:predicted dithiol-disulfide oxidoreductase (DUF899 family)
MKGKVMNGRLLELATPGYSAARDELRERERALDVHREEVAAARRALPPGPVVAEDYAFSAIPDGATTRLSELFGGRRSLLVYSMMFGPGWDAPCPMCRMWVDGLHGVAGQLGERTAFAVVAAGSVPALTALAHERGWTRMPVLSSAGTGWAADMGSEDEDGNQVPVVLVLERSADGTIRLVYRGTPGLEPDGSGERGIDPVCPVWSVLDLLPEGRGDWYPAGDYSFVGA